MKLILSNKLYIEDATATFAKWCADNLVFDNPDYISRERLGKWTGNVDRYIAMYERRGNDLILPFGTFRKVWTEFKGDFTDSRCDISPVRARRYNSAISIRDYQSRAVDAVLRGKNGILVAPCGSGKTQMGLAIAARIGGKCLWLTHTSDLLSQSMTRARECFDLPASEFGTITGGKVNVGNTITFATVQTMSNIDLFSFTDEWDTIIVDECFPKGTKIATPNGNKDLTDLQNGDIITSYNCHKNIIENKRVTHVFKLKAHNIMKVILSNGKTIVCTGNHPFFVKDKGWISAEKLGDDDYVMQLLREGNRRNEVVKNVEEQEQAQRVGLLLQGMLTERGSGKTCVHRRNARDVQQKNDGNEFENSGTNIGKNANKQSDEKSRSESGCIKTIKRNRTLPENKVREWSGIDSSATKIDDRTCENTGSFCGVSDTDENAAGKRISNLLQSRHCDRGQNDCNRSGRKYSLLDRKAGTGQEKDSFFEWVRVESVEVQEQTSDGTFGGLCADGFVYNIEVEDNNNYFVDGVLVHNCHHTVGSPTRLQMFYKVLSALSARYKIGLTATPYRADGLDGCMFAVLGDVLHEVKKSEVEQNTCPVKVKFFDTGYTPNTDVVLAGDGTIVYSALVKDLTENEARNNFISEKIQGLKNSCVLVLSDRVEHLKKLFFKCAWICHAECIDGSMQSKAAKEKRKRILSDLNEGRLNVVFATYKLAKEGLDVPNLRHVVFASPLKDKSAVIQSAGRVARKADGKKFGTIIDFTDNFGLLRGYERKRKSIYRKLKYEITD